MLSFFGENELDVISKSKIKRSCSMMNDCRNGASWNRQNDAVFV